MIVKELGNADLFLKEYEETLLENETSSQLLLSAALQCQSNSEDTKDLYGSVMEDTRVVLLFTIARNRDLILYSADSLMETEAAVALADYLGDSHIVISGLNARQTLCQCFIEQYKKYLNGTFIPKLESDIMELRQVNEVKPVNGNQRLALPSDVKIIADWIIQFQIEALMDETDYEAAVMKATNMVDQKELYLYEDEEQQVVSMAAATRKLVHGIGITYIFTPEEYRGNGYAAANIYYLSKALLEQGNEFCTLFVDKRNPLTNRAYEKVGYKMLEDNCEYKIIPIEV